MVELEYIIKHRISDKKWISSSSSENASVKSSTTDIQFSPESRTLTPSPVIISQPSYRTSPSTIDSRILQSSVCGTQSQWKLQTNNRFITPEPVSKDSFIFHGVSFHNPESFRRLPLGSDPGPFRRLLPCTNSSQSSTFTLLFSESPSVPIQGSSLWSGFSPIRLHMDSKTFSLTPSETGHPNTCLLENTLLQHLHMTLTLASQLGFKVNLGKSKLIPSQDLTYLGVRFLLDLQLANPSEVHLQQIRTWVSLLLHQDNLPACKWAQFLDLLNFVAHFIPHGRLAIRPIHQHLAANWDFNGNHADTPIPQAPSLTQDLLQWTDPQFVAQGIPLLPPPAHSTLFTDASLEGWGAHYHQHQASGLWSLEESTLHINILEMKAVLLAITQLQSVLKGHVIVIATDNTSVLGYLKNQGGAKCPEILPWTYQVFHLCQSLNISFTAKHVPGHKNVLADQLSQKDQGIQTEWTLRLDVCHWLWKKWFLPQVDAFATLWTHRLPLYFSPLPDPRAVAVDALSQQWTTHTLFLFPPTPLLPAVLRKLQRPH